MLPVDAEPIANGAVEVEDDRIVAVGSADEIGDGERWEASAIVPGFVNAHTHVEYAVYAGFGDGLGDFADWLALHVERKSRIAWDEFVAIARAGAATSLASGVTTIADASFSGAAAVAASDLGLRAVVYLEVFGAEPGPALARMQENRSRVEHAFSDRVRPGVSPHAPYSVSLDVYRACAALGLPMATHLSESPSEVEYLLTGGGPWGPYRELLVEPAGATGTRMLVEAGLLGPEVVAAHCVVVDDEEIGLLAAHGTGVAHCPRSNASLGCGVAPLAELRAAGARVGLGTDSPASAPSLDVFEEVRSAILSARARARQPDVLPASEALELATLGSARALGLDEEIGSLAPGKKADLTVVSLAGSPYLPWEDPAAAVVYGGSPERVELTLVDGEERYRKGGTEGHDLRRSAAAARARMLGEAPVAQKT